MKGKDKFIVFLSLTFLGILFRLFYGIIGPSSLEWGTIFLYGSLSGLGVATGIILSLKLEQLPNMEVVRRLVPYVCGGLAVLFAKLCVKLIYIFIGGMPKHENAIK